MNSHFYYVFKGICELLITILFLEDLNNSPVGP